jgi:uncharacterized protein (DUF58 family)
MTSGTASSHRGTAGAALGLTPDVLRALERLAIPSRRPVFGTGAGQRRSRYHGGSPDLADYRAYVPADDLRRLDWSAYARLGRLYTRLYAGEEDSCVTFWLDTSASMSWDEPGKERSARAVAGALGFLALAGEDRVACVGFSGSLVGRTGPLRGKRSAPQLWATLVQLERGGTADWKAVAGHARSSPRGIAVVVSDFISEPRLVRPALLALREAGNEVVLVQVLSGEELRPSLRGELCLVDAETGATVEVTLGRAALDAYQLARTAHARAIAALASAYGARFVSIDGSKPLRHILIDQLARAGVIR